MLPEMWNCPYSNDSFPTYAEDLDAGPSPSTQVGGGGACSLPGVLLGQLEAAGQLQRTKQQGTGSRV